jgi:hypothetical protein
MSFCTRSRISTLKWALSYDTPEIAHIARCEVAYREIGAGFELVIDGTNRQIVLQLLAPRVGEIV